MALKGAGVTVAWASGPSMAINSIDWSGMTRDAIPTTSLSTTGGETFIPAATYDPGSLTMECQFDPTDSLQADDAFADVAEACTVTFDTGDTYAASSFVTGWGVNVGSSKDLQLCTIELKFSGDITSATV